MSPEEPQEEPKAGKPPKVPLTQRERRLALILGFASICVTGLVAVVSTSAAFSYSERLDRAYDRIEEAENPERSQVILGDEGGSTTGLCSEENWSVGIANSEDFEFREVREASNGSYVYAGGCEIYLDVFLEGEAAGEAVVEIQTIDDFPREIPWGTTTESDCSRVFEASTNLFDSILEIGSSQLPENNACLKSVETEADSSYATLWAHGLENPEDEEDGYNYVEITLNDLDPESGDAAARSKAFSEFFTGEFTETLEGKLPAE